ncbi:MAG: UDP-N-acetylmuramoyl-tripeptide--D-alanyl-D-alanine ligase [Bradymonadia bacterium]|jgi:UDP-N-acetylmuramoyl-tripeptide--D-alanyl-D-alanine ligase
MQSILQTLSAAELCDYLQGQWHGAREKRLQAVGAVCTDSRKLSKGNFFVAIRGENFDGHDFLAQVREAGAELLVVEDPSRLTDGDVAIVVDDATLALGRLAKALIKIRRAAGNFELYAITGSNGKTTCKEMLSALLTALGKNVLKTRGNFNNALGLPFTVFDLSLNHEAAVLEMGTNAVGEIAYLVDIAEPDVALITSIGDAHLQGFGTREGVARAKGEILASPNLRKAVMSAQLYDEFYSNALPASLLRCLGRDAKIHNLVSSASGLCFEYIEGEHQLSVELDVLGRHNAQNFALAMLCLGAERLNSDVVVRASALLEMPAGRLERYTSSVCELLHDAYNANPSSMRAAFRLMQDLRPSAERAYVIGEMAELGADSERMHYEVGGLLGASAAKAVLFVGAKNAEAMAQGAKAAGLVSGSVHICSSEALGEGLEKFALCLAPTDLCLIKGSRSMRLERVLEFWRAAR